MKENIVDNLNTSKELINTIIKCLDKDDRKSRLVVMFCVTQLIDLLVNTELDVYNYLRELQWKKN